MPDVSIQTLDELSDALRGRDFIILGEVHGSKQNAPLVQALLRILLESVESVAVAFEWKLTSQELQEMRDYVHGGKIPHKLPEFFLDSDGRFTYEHASLLKWMRTYNTTHGNNIDFHTFDIDSNADSEFAMAKSLRGYKEIHQLTTVLVITGNVHARKTPYIFMGKKYTPMTMLLRSDYNVCTIFIRYRSGEVNVEGRPRDVTNAASQQEDPTDHFDAVIEIPLSEASESPADLTQIVRLL